MHCQETSQLIAPGSADPDRALKGEPFHSLSLTIIELEDPTQVAVQESGISWTHCQASAFIQGDVCIDWSLVPRRRSSIQKEKAFKSSTKKLQQTNWVKIFSCFSLYSTLSMNKRISPRPLAQVPTLCFFAHQPWLDLAEFQVTTADERWFLSAKSAFSKNK